MTPPTVVCSAAPSCGELTIHTKSSLASTYWEGAARAHSHQAAQDH